MRTTNRGHRRVIHGVAVIFGLLCAAACESNSGGLGEERWAVVQDYLDRQAAWEEQAGDVWSILMTGVGSFEELIRRAEGAHGALPDATAAVEAARAIVAARGPRTVEAAEFLIKRRGLPHVVRAEMETSTAAAGPDNSAKALRLRGAEDPTWRVLIAHIGPDWPVVQAYIDARGEWWGRVTGTAPDDDAPGVSFGAPPSAIRAVAAARAILNAGGEHPQTVEAAEFLTLEAWSTGPGDDRHLVAGARSLVQHAPDFDRWLDALRALDRGRYGGGSDRIDAFLEEMASTAEDTVLRAGARYYVASGLMRGINDPSQMSASPENHAELRARALVAATGLSAGLEEEPFAANVGGAPQAARTFADAEAELVASIRHATVEAPCRRRRGAGSTGARSRCRPTAAGSC